MQPKNLLDFKINIKMIFKKDGSNDPSLIFYKLFGKKLEYLKMDKKWKTMHLHVIRT